MGPFTDVQIAQLCRGLEQEKEFVFLETSRVSRHENRSLLFLKPRTWLVCGQEADADLFLRRAESWLEQGCFLAGWIAYEFAFLLEPLRRAVPDGVRSRGKGSPLAVLGVFAEPHVYRHDRGDFAAFLADAGLSAVRKDASRECMVRNLRTNINRDEYLQAMRRIGEYIRAGDTYQVNFTLRLDFDFAGSPATLYRRLRRNQSVAYGAWIRHGGTDVMSFSPELFFQARPGRVRVRPMKGTMARGRTIDEDRRRARVLENDTKNRSENVMIVDLLRNDLGRLLHETGRGRVRPRSLFDVETYETVLQMTSTIDALADDHRSFGLRRLLQALFPCGSVTGAPKIRTMEIIRELEKDPRGVYCGAIGFCSPQEAVFNVPIRTLELAGGHGSMGIGSGVVHDSDPEAEWEECLLKGAFLSRPAPVFHLIETLLWQPGEGYLLFEEHLQRLAQSAAYFLFQHDAQVVRERLLALTGAFARTPVRVRLLLARDGELEISHQPLAGWPRHILSTRPRVGSPLPEVCFSRHRTDPDDVFLFHKTTRRRLYDRERQQVVGRGKFEVLFVNSRGEVTEGSISNVFVRREGQLLTPPVSCGLLAGTFRRWLLEQGAAREKVLDRQDLCDAEAVFIGNSLRGLVQVRLLC